MNKKLLKKLLVNALNQLVDELDNCGCNDLFPDDTLISNLSKKELEELRLSWIKNFPKLADEMDNELCMNTFVVETLIKLVKKEIK